MKKYLIPCILFLAQFSCTSLEGEISEINNMKIDSDINHFIYQYIKTLQSDTIKLVDEYDCNQTDGNINNFHQGVYTYQIDQIKKIRGFLNSDSIYDYCITYTAYNCWEGIGTGNYLSNLFFMLQKNDYFEVDKTMTDDFKQSFLNQLNLVYPKNSMRNIFKNEEFVNKVEIQSIQNNIIFGYFELLQCGGIPCITGEFQYNINSKTTILDKLRSY